MRLRPWVVVPVAVAAVAAGCGGPRRAGTTGATAPVTSSPASPSASGPASPSGGAPAGSTAVRFAATDGVRLAGRLFGQGNAGVVLVHQIDDDQTDWWDFAGTLQTKGYLALTFDLRGICRGGLGGCSRGAPDPSAGWKDAIGAIRFIRSRGARTVQLIGASMGGEVSIVTASKLGGGLDGLIGLSASEGVAGLLDLDVAHMTVAAITAPKLFMAGRFDSGFASYARDYFDHARPPKQLRILDTSDHGINLLRHDEDGTVTALVLGFLDRHR